MTFESNIWNTRNHAYLLLVDGKEHLRPGQPCYGELRKYESTHKGDCTQPLDQKPGDLHCPFPEGNPTGVVFPFNKISGWETISKEANDLMFEAFFGERSPWLKGITPRTFITHEGRIGAVQFHDAKIDPTVLVNLCKNFRNSLARADDLLELVKYGMSLNEATAVLLLNTMSFKLGINMPSAYSVAKDFSVRRFFDHTPNDHSGGLLCDRIDYNRKRMQDTFKCNDKEGENPANAYSQVSWWTTEMIAKGHPRYPILASGKPIDIKKFVLDAKELFLERYRQEETPVIVPYIWKTTSGKTNQK